MLWRRFSAVSDSSTEMENLGTAIDPFFRNRDNAINAKPLRMSPTIITDAGRRTRDFRMTERILKNVAVSFFDSTLTGDLTFSSHEHRQFHMIFHSRW
jgi:hypothetical protein